MKVQGNHCSLGLVMKLVFDIYRRDFLPISTIRSSLIDQFRICVPIVPRITPGPLSNSRLGRTGIVNSGHRGYRMVGLFTYTIQVNRMVVSFRI